MNVFARITKVDEAKREVWGRAAEEVVDKVDEIWDYAKSKPYFEAWSKEFSDTTDGKSLGNIRAMHGKIAAGKAIHLDFKDTEKALDIGTKIVDDGEWTKVLEGVYTGFSIGGSYVGERTTEKIDGRDVKRYVAKPTEISLVDSPCIPTAKFFEVVKADGVVEKVAFKPAAIEVRGTDEEVAQLGKSLNDAGMTLANALEALAVEAMLITAEEIEKREFSADERKSAAKAGEALPDGSFPIKSKGDLANAVKAYGRAKNKAAAKAHIMKRAKALGATDMLPDSWKDGGKEEKAAEGTLKKGMWDVQTFAQCLSCLASVCRGAQEDFDYEGDESEVPMKLRNAFAELVDCFREMADEEAQEMLAELKQHAEVGDDDEIEEAMEAAARAGSLRKRLTNPDLPFVDFVKIAEKELGAEAFAKLKTSSVSAVTEAVLAKKMSAAHMDKMQAIHDHSVSMGADCAGQEKEAAAKPAEVKKAADEAGDLTKALEAANKRIEALEKQPQPHVVLRTVQKVISGPSSEAVRDALTAMPYEKLMKFADGTIDWTSSERLLIQSGAA